MSDVDRERERRPMDKRAAFILAVIGVLLIFAGFTNRLGDMLAAFFAPGALAPNPNANASATPSNTPATANPLTVGVDAVAPFTTGFVNGILTTVG
jgi:hypothetical protein